MSLGEKMKKDEGQWLRFMAAVEVWVLEQHLGGAGDWDVAGGAGLSCGEVRGQGLVGRNVVAGLYQERCWDFFPAGDCFRTQYEDQLS